jgi:hypothetical protein
MRSRPLAVKALAVFAACLTASALIITAATPASAATTPNNVYMVNKVISPASPASPFEVLLPSVTVAGTQMGVTVIYRNVSNFSATLSCSPLQPTSVTMNGSIYMESSSYCGTHPNQSITVPAGGKFPSWAKYNVVPDLAVPFTLNSWWGYGPVTNIQLIPFQCLQGPGGSCQGLPRRVPVDQLPTPPRWMTSPATGACVLSIAAVASPQIKLLNVWIAGLGGAIRASSATRPVDKAYIIITTAMKAALPFSGCAALGADLGIQGLRAVASSQLPVVKAYPRLVTTT